MKEASIKKAIELIRKKNNGKTIKVKTKGKSMYPLVPEKAVIEVEISDKKLNQGDIIMYYLKNRFLIHRIIKEKEGKLIVKGDNNFGFDPLLEKEMILGKVTKINGKKIDSIEFKILKKPITVFSFITGKMINKLWGVKE